MLLSQFNTEVRIKKNTKTILKHVVGDKKKVENVTISKLLPETIGYMTYQGSQTAPGCSEVVTWMILNKPIYITQKQVLELSSSFHCQFRLFFNCNLYEKNICST